MSGDWLTLLSRSATRLWGSVIMSENKSMEKDGVSKEEMASRGRHPLRLRDPLKSCGGGGFDEPQQCDRRRERETSQDGLKPSRADGTLGHICPPDLPLTRAEWT